MRRQWIATGPLALTTVCRVGGRNFSFFSRATRYPANEYAVELQECFGIDVENDEDRVHPPSICTVCSRLVSRYRDAVSAGRAYTLQSGGCADPKRWTSHLRVGCTFCQPAVRTGRPKKKRRNSTSTLRVDHYMTESESEEETDWSWNTACTRMNRHKVKRLWMLQKQL